ncbi:MAG: helix-turn-helix domain-containing protein [Gammaproteobacteria bacterium]|nr:helix-turn-helix domain-containing protein [Gammaproteobacteria bacterium]
MSTTVCRWSTRHRHESVNLTQREFAKLLDVSIDTIQDWEQGRRRPRGAAETLLKIAQIHPKVLEQLASRPKLLGQNKLRS